MIIVLGYTGSFGISLVLEYMMYFTFHSTPTRRVGLGRRGAADIRGLMVGRKILAGEGELDGAV